MSNQNKLLAIVYTFLPYVDTSGNVFAKRLCTEFKRPTIVITNKYLSNPPIDNSLLELVQPYIIERIELNSTFTYREWLHFNNFINGAVSSYEEMLAKGVKISTIYSRSMSVITHLAAFLIKKKNPELEWIAEFSDPIIKDVDGSERFTEVPEHWIKSSELEKILFPFDDNRNLFFISELLPYFYADKIIFTNDLQKNYMLSYLKEKTLNKNLIPDLIKSIENKIKISVHPTLHAEFYKKREFSENLENKYINIGYFGNINFNRNFNELIHAWEKLSKLDKKRIRLYVYTNMNEGKIKSNFPAHLWSSIFVRPALNYLEYLNSLDKFDYLLTLDTKVNEIFGMNPFLPSKISDYLGSNTKIFAIVEKGSPTDLLENNIIFKQYMGNISFKKLLQDFDNGKSFI